MVSADPSLLAVGALHWSVALPLVGGGDEPEEPPDPDEPPLLGGGADPEVLPDEPLEGTELDPELPALDWLLVALAAGELEPEPPPQPERMSMAAARPQSVLRGPMHVSSPGWSS